MYFYNCSFVITIVTFVIFDGKIECIFRKPINSLIKRNEYNAKRKMSRELEFRSPSCSPREYVMKYKGGKGGELKYQFSPNNFHTVTKEEVQCLPTVLPLTGTLNRFSHLNEDEIPKTAFFPNKTIIDKYYKRKLSSGNSVELNPDDYEFLFGTKHTDEDCDERFWYKACFLHKNKQSFVLLSATNIFKLKNSLISSLDERYWTCQNGMIATPQFWYNLRMISKFI